MTLRAPQKTRLSVAEIVAKTAKRGHLCDKERFSRVSGQRPPIVIAQIHTTYRLLHD
ncbi:hypothetical protein JYU34_002763, partial [Plutella xylostella]